MKPLRVDFPVHTWDNRLLVPAGTEVTPGLVEEIVRSCPGGEKEISLLSHGSVGTDLESLLGKPPYGSIFSRAEDVEWLWRIMDRITLLPSVLEAIEYFKTADVYTYHHMLLVFALTTLVARSLLEDPDEIVDQSATGPTHDIGKCCVPPAVLKKSDPLTPEERDMLQHHAMAGSLLMSYYHGVRDLAGARVALEHHERRDGSGYPRGIRDLDPMVEIIAACDVYDALISRRPYRSDSFDNRTALEEITAMAETGRIGWDVVRALIAINRNSKPSYTEVIVSAEKRGSPPVRNSYGVTADPEGPVAC